MAFEQIVTVPGHHMPLHHLATTPEAKQAITVFLKDLAIKLGDTSGAPYTLQGHMVNATNVLLGQIPYVVGDHRYVEYTGNPKYAKTHILYRPVSVKPYFRGTAIDHHELLAYGIMRDQLDPVQSEQDTDRSLDARLAHAALVNGTSTAADDLDFDGQAFLLGSAAKRFNPADAGFGLYQTLFGSTPLNGPNVKAGLDKLWQRRGTSGELLRLWEYPVELWCTADKYTEAEDICKLATLIPRPGLGTAGGGSGSDLNTGGNTNTIVARNLIPRILEHAATDYNAWHLQSLAPFAKPLIKATPPDPIFPVYFPRGSDPNAINEEKAGFLVSMGFRWRTAVGHVKFTYS